MEVNSQFSNTNSNCNSVRESSTTSINNSQQQNAQRENHRVYSKMQSNVPFTLKSSNLFLDTSTTPPMPVSQKMFMRNFDPYTTEQVKETVVDCVSVQYVENLVEVPQVVRKARVVNVPKVEKIQRTVPVQRTKLVEKLVEVPQYHYKEVPYEKIIQVPEVQTEVVVREVGVPTKVEVSMPVPRSIPVQQIVYRNIPVPVDLRTVQNFKVPQIKANYVDVPVPLYVPRYVQIPVPASYVPGESFQNFNYNQIGQYHSGSLSASDTMHSNTRKSTNASLRTISTPRGNLPSSTMHADQAFFDTGMHALVVA